MRMLSLSEYDAFVLDMIDPKVKELGPVGILFWGITKLNSEAGELAGALARREYHQREVDEREFVFEDGDCLFYVSVIAQALGYSTQHVLDSNVAKLTERGNYANYLSEKMAAEKPVAYTPQEQALIDAVLRAVRDSGELDPAESSP
jgi:NTP pyrophosphatase (non-canonical NTP hydrolase)